MNLLVILVAILFGIVEGVTEWLPISSTGHMILLAQIVPFKMSPQFVEMFMVVVQFGAILAVVERFWQKLWPFCHRKNNTHNFLPLSREVGLDKSKLRLWGNIMIACVPAAVIGVFFSKMIKEYLYNFWVVAIMLVVVGILFIMIENYNQSVKQSVRTIGDITWQLALIVGGFQVLAAILPGTSRSGATILGALIFGFTRAVATEFTFYLAVPVMFGASLLEIFKFGLGFSFFELTVLLIGSITAFIVSIVAINFLMGYVKKHDFKIFGWYRIALGVVVIVGSLILKYK